MPETLAQKQERFLEQTLAPDQVLDAAGQAARGIVQPAALKPVLFEEGARLESPAITADRRVFIGAHSYMNGQGYLRSNVFIGRFCSIGRRVTIGAGGHRMTGLSTSPLLSAGPMHRHYDAQEVAALGFPAQETIGMPTIIGSDVWIGDGAIIMPGVHVGVGAVIGANSVVTRDIAPYAGVGGVPARPIRTRFDKTLSARLLASAWWELSSDRLKQLPLGHVPRFLDALEALAPQARAPHYATLAIAS